MIIDAHCHLGRSPQFHFPDVSVDTMLASWTGWVSTGLSVATWRMLQGAWELGFRESLAAFRAVGRPDHCSTPLSIPARRDGLEFVAQVPRPRGVRGHQDPSFVARMLRRRRPLRAGLAVRRPGERVPDPRLIPGTCRAQNPAQKYSFPSRFETFAAAYPDVTLILGHAGGRYRRTHRRRRSGPTACPTCSLDTAGDCYTLGLIEYLVEQAGSDKVLFGSDLTWIDPRTQLGMILDADITSEAKQRILQATMPADLFRLVGDIVRPTEP